MSKKTIFRLIPVTLAASLALAGCGTSGTQPAPAAASHAATALTVSEPWAKASSTTMTGVFGVLKNPTGHDVVVSGASSTAAKTVELHETVKGADGTMAMRAKKGGFTIPANGEFTLEPGANHIMLMGLVKPLAAGDEVTVELAMSDGGKVTFSAPAKDFSGANENYQGSHDGGMDHGSMDHGGMDHGSMDHSAHPSAPASHPAAK